MPNHFHADFSIVRTPGLQSRHRRGVLNTPETNTPESNIPAPTNIVNFGTDTNINAGTYNTGINADINMGVCNSDVDMGANMGG